MIVRKKLWRALLGVFILAQSAWASPAIQNQNFTAGGGGWTSVGIGTSSTVLFGQTNPNILGGDPSYGLVVSRGGAANGLSRFDFFDNVQSGGTSIADADPNFGSAMDGTRFTGVYQAFTTGKAGSISFDAVAFSSVPSQANGDPFAFIFNTGTNTGTFVRGGTIVPNFVGSLPDGTSGDQPLLGAAAQPHPNLVRALGTGTNAARLAGLTYTFTNLAAGNYIIGFGFGTQNAVSNWGGLAVNNIVDPGVPEIDTAAAGLPVAIVLILFFVLLDRRGRKGPALVPGNS